ncbi:hypothetical protein RE476_01045 [Methanolobus mangrovi]|uniref:Uncharacterized protein n=1 Tax=Methanolobus mangrovi TaxID=3072977 RepID=A0AA51UGE1_9EURY|nr:hypothetical protein [Methanolobus mangrovi]WMW22434.1 hypothetical protein RE476_01045 [Methanolobus mangrovi]
MSDYLNYLVRTKDTDPTDSITNIKEQNLQMFSKRGKFLHDRIPYRLPRMDKRSLVYD